MHPVHLNIKHDFTVLLFGPVLDLEELLIKKHMPVER